MGAAARPPAGDAVALGELVLEGYRQVREGGAQQDRLALDPVGADRRRRAGPMAHTVATHDLVGGLQLAQAKDLLVQTPGARLVLNDTQPCCSHRLLLFRPDPRWRLSVGTARPEDGRGSPLGLPVERPKGHAPEPGQAHARDPSGPAIARSPRLPGLHQPATLPCG